MLLGGTGKLYELYFNCAFQVALGILKRTGYSQVTTVMDGQLAMDELQRRGGADAFDIILTDLHMPRKVHHFIHLHLESLGPTGGYQFLSVLSSQSSYRMAVYQQNA